MLSSKPRPITPTAYAMIPVEKPNQQITDSYRIMLPFPGRHHPGADLIPRLTLDLANVLAA